MDISVFDPPDNFNDFDMLSYPSHDDQIELIHQRQSQIARVLAFYRGNERDYQTLKRESDILFAVHRTLCAVKKLCNTQQVGVKAT